MVDISPDLIIFNNQISSLYAKYSCLIYNIHHTTLNISNLSSENKR